MWSTLTLGSRTLSLPLCRLCVPGLATGNPEVGPLAKTLAVFEINDIAGGRLPEFGYNSDYAQRALARVRVAPSTVPPENLEISESMRVIRPS